MNDFYVVGKKLNGKKIVSIKCNSCSIRNEVQEQYNHKIKLYYCRSCSSSGSRNGMFQKGHLISGSKNGNHGGLSKEHKKNLSKAKTGKKINLSEEARKKKKEIGTENFKKWMKENPEKHRESSRRGGINSLKLQANYGRISGIEQKTIDWLNSKNINYIFQYSIENKFLYDFKIGKYIVEVNGIWFHNLPNQIIRDNTKKKLAEDKGFEVIYIWEDEVNNNDFSKIEAIL